MSDNNIKKHLRAALDHVVAKEVNKLEAELADQDDRQKKEAEIMAPVIAAIKALRDEVGEVDDLSIMAISQQKAFIQINYDIVDSWLEISSDLDNRKFLLYSGGDIDIDDAFSVDEFLKVDTAEEVMEVVVRIVGKHIAAETMSAKTEDI